MFGRGLCNLSKHVLPSLTQMFGCPTLRGSASSRKPRVLLPWPPVMWRSHSKETGFLIRYRESRKGGIVTRIEMLQCQRCPRTKKRRKKRCTRLLLERRRLLCAVQRYVTRYTYTRYCYRKRFKWRPSVNSQFRTAPVVRGI